MNFTNIQGDLYDGFALLTKCDEKISKKGTKYLDIMLTDNTGEISSKIWEFTGDEGFEVDTVVKVRGSFEKYNNVDQFRIKNIRLANEYDEYNLSDLVPSSEVSGEILYNMILNIVNTFSDEEIKQIVLKIYEDNKKVLIQMPAALQLHHAMVGGLMYHTMSILKMAQALSKIYTNVNTDLLFAGAILHDVAKTVEYESSNTGLAKGYTIEGELIGHLVKGAMMVSKAADDLGIDSQKVVLLEHMVISHHGKPEYGAAVMPKFLEAEILAQLDNLDATIFEFNAATDATESGNFSDKKWALDNRKIFNHGLSSTKHNVNFED